MDTYSCIAKSEAAARGSAIAKYNERDLWLPSLNCLTFIPSKEAAKESGTNIVARVVRRLHSVTLVLIA